MGNGDIIQGQLELIAAVEVTEADVHGFAIKRRWYLDDITLIISVPRERDIITVGIFLLCK